MTDHKPIKPEIQGLPQLNPIEALEEVYLKLSEIQATALQQLAVVQYLPLDRDVIADVESIGKVAGRIHEISEEIVNVADTTISGLVERLESEPTANLVSVEGEASRDDDSVGEQPDNSVDAPANSNQTDMDTDTDPASEKPPVEVIRLRRALKYLSRQPEGEKKFHPKIVKKAFGHSLDRVTSEEYEDFLEDLDQLVDRGILESNKNGSQFWLKPGVDIETIDVQSLLGIEKGLVDDEEIVLSGIEQALLMMFSQSGAVRMQDIRLSIDELSTLDTKSDEWLDFKASFEAKQQRIVRYMNQHQYRAEWVTTGRTRGTRYKLYLQDKRR